MMKESKEKEKTLGLWFIGMLLALCIIPALVRIIFHIIGGIGWLIKDNTEYDDLGNWLIKYFQSFDAFIFNESWGFWLISLIVFLVFAFYSYFLTFEDEI